MTSSLGEPLTTESEAVLPISPTTIQPQCCARTSALLITTSIPPTNCAFHAIIPAITAVRSTLLPVAPTAPPSTFAVLSIVLASAMQDTMTMELLHAESATIDA
jgi:hypothetical protein